MLIISQTMKVATSTIRGAKAKKTNLVKYIASVEYVLSKKQSNE